MASPTTLPIEYAFDNSAHEATVQFRALERYLDPITLERLGPDVVAPGMTCWEVGAGGGSIARHLAHAVAPGGHVVATDLDTSRLTARPLGPSVSVYRHDVRSGAAAGGPFDLIHARLVLLHLPERRRVLQDLIGALTPGGWLVLEEFDCSRIPPVLTAPGRSEAALYRRVMTCLLRVIERQGADLAWAHDVHDAMAAAGLSEVDTVRYSESWAGGSSGAGLYAVNARQLQPALTTMGIRDTELAAFQRLLRNPRFATLSYEFVSTRGRKPTAPATTTPDART